MIDENTIIVATENGKIVSVGHLVPIAYVEVDVANLAKPGVPAAGSAGIVIPTKAFSARVGQSVALRGTMTADFDQASLRWAAVTGNPTIANAGNLESVTFNYPAPGTYRVSLTALSRDGLRTAQDFTTVTVTA